MPADKPAPGPWLRRALLLIQSVLVLAPLVFWDGGLLESEATVLVPRYLDERAVFRKVFDPRGNDFGAYQARELSYLVDWADAHLLDGLLAVGLPVFVPASALLSALLTVLVWRWGVARVLPRAEGVASGLLLMLYLSGFVVVVTLGMYYRSGKPLLAPAVLALLFLVVDAARAADRERSRRRTWMLGALAVVISLLDRQGFFLVATATALTALGWLATRKLTWPLAALAAAATAGEVYNRLLGPVLIDAANGYWPRFKYQDVWLWAPFRKPERFLQAGEVIVDNVSMLLGSLPVWAWTIAGAAIAAWWVAKRRSVNRAEGVQPAGLLRRPLPYVLLAAASLVVMFALMIVRHRPVYDFYDHRIWYHPLVLHVLLLFGLLLALEELLPHLRGRQVLAVHVVLIAMIAGNVLHWPTYRNALHPWFPHVLEQSTLLKQSLRDGVPHPGLAADQREFFRVMQERRSRGR